MYSKLVVIYSKSCSNWSNYFYIFIMSNYNIQLNQNLLFMLNENKFTLVHHLTLYKLDPDFMIHFFFLGYEHQQFFVLSKNHWVRINLLILGCEISHYTNAQIYGFLVPLILYHFNSYKFIPGFFFPLYDDYMLPYIISITYPIYSMFASALKVVDRLKRWQMFLKKNILSLLSTGTHIFTPESLSKGNKEGVR